MKYRAAIFDLDGTLVDSLGDMADSINAVLALYNYPQHPIERYGQMAGDGIISLIRRSLPADRAGDIDFIISCLPLVDAEYDKRWYVRTHPYEGIPELLQLINDKRVGLAILSNKPHPFVTKFMPHFFPNIKFDVIFGARPGIPQKPSPAAAYEIASIIGIDASECIFIGDSCADMLTGKAADMFSVGVTWGFRPVQELLDAGADIVVTHPVEIMNLLEGLVI
jgi:phosphoglycolate phosphatase